MTVIRPNGITGITSITALNDTISVYKSDGTTAGLQLDGVNFNTTGVSTVGQLNVGTGGTVITTTANGLVGVGTDNPTELLHLIGGSSSSAGTQVDIMRLVASDFSPINSGGLTIGAVWHNTDVSRRIAYLQSSQNIDSGSTNRSLVLNPNGGNVGIGTDDPVEKLEVKDAVNDVTLQITTTGTSKWANLYLVGGTTENYLTSNQALSFWISGSEKARILAGGGLTFNGDTAAANALDDYEEGTWSPVDNSAGLTFSLAAGRYVKIGSLVHFWGQVQYPSTSDTNSTEVGGFPFTNLHTSPLNYSGNIAITSYGSADILPMVENNVIKFRNYSNVALTNANLSGKFVYLEFDLRT